MSYARPPPSRVGVKEKEPAKPKKFPIDDLLAQQQVNNLELTHQSFSALSKLHQKQQRAQEAMEHLQLPPKSNASQWTSEHHDVLSENLRLLMDSTSDPKVKDDTESEDEEETDDEEYEGDEEESEVESSESEAEEDGDDDDNDPPTQPQAGQKQSTSPKKATQGQKRQREEKEADSDAEDTPIDKTQRPSKKTKLRTGITQHVLQDFETLQPQPLQFTFPEHPDEDRSDEWYVTEFRVLFRRIFKFSSDFFGLHDIDVGEFHQPWAAGMTPEFIRHVEDVAEADPMDGSWDTLLRNNVQREWLIVAVIMRILEIHVFGADLWGAEPEQKALLLDLERALLTREGFSRTALRSQTVRTIIGAGPITQNFHSEVAKLTAKVALLLKPLTFFLYSRPTKDGGPNQKVEDQYQALHNIIAIAAYLSICIRLSPTIFYFSTVTPNTPYSEADHHSVDSDGWIRSRDAVLKAFGAKNEAYDKKKEALEGELAKLKAAGKSETSRVFKYAQAKLDAHVAAQPKPPSHTHAALTKVGAWPNISRFKPGTRGDDDARVPLEKRKGFRIFEVCKSAVVCYYGLEQGRAKRAVKRVRLEDFAKEKVKRFGKRGSAVGKSVVIAAAAAAVAGIPYFLYG